VPPDAWTFSIQTPSEVAADTALSHRVGDVVEFQIQENAVTFLDERADDWTALRGKQSAAYFEPSGHPAKGIGERRGLGRGLDVECD
jgi:hypothetical protein